MKRYLIMTIGVTHSGKTTFGKLVEQMHTNFLVIDQDNQAAFLNTHYPKLVPIGKENILKIGLSQFLLNYAIQETNYHIIISSANLKKVGRNSLIKKFFPRDQWAIIYVYFNFNDSLLMKRIQTSTRSTEIFRNQSLTFEALLQTHQRELDLPSSDEADYIFEINDQNSVEDVLERLHQLMQ